tara:strand:+ start:4059 stop:4616 length:558 start_codon:yes stop_codon:yes gene_type:complete
MARQAGDLGLCVFVDYGHPAQVPEGWKAFAYCGERGVPLKVVHAFGLALGDMATEAGARVVPGRNALLLAIAANASSGGPVVIGCNKADQDAYKDCRRTFLSTMSAALGVAIESPLIHKTKAEIIGMARALGLSRSDAWACYGAGPKPCGTCPSCQESARAWGADCCGRTWRQIEANGHAKGCEL